ncbi:hypothetical protein [Lysinibacillus sp. RC79]|uniref:hypothetical protein n=1 Tax=Lysinibacillus sp. RC79 TaxID=3156296 RepID=UPI0035176A52
MAKCNKHLWLDTNDGSFDQRCINCGIKRMQGVMAMPTIAIDHQPKIEINVQQHSITEQLLLAAGKAQALEFRRLLNNC